MGEMRCGGARVAVHPTSTDYTIHDSLRALVSGYLCESWQSKCSSVIYFDYLDEQSVIQGPRFIWFVSVPFWYDELASLKHFDYTSYVSREVKIYIEEDAKGLGDD